VTGGVDQRGRRNVKSRVMELGRLTAGSESSDLTSAFNRLVPRGKSESYRDLLPFSAVDLGCLRDADGREPGDGGRKLIQYAHDSSPICDSFFGMLLGRARPSAARAQRVSAPRHETRAKKLNARERVSGVEDPKPTVNALP
jgi:hypothetical protein